MAGYKDFLIKNYMIQFGTKEIYIVSILDYQLKKSEKIKLNQIFIIIFIQHLN